jgi:hypothetical protein
MMKKRLVKMGAVVIENNQPKVGPLLLPLKMIRV